jgi:hypothetical protein
MRRPRTILLLLLGCLLIAAFLLVYPLSIIQPFKHQDSRDLTRALFVFRIAPTTSIAIAILAVAICIAGWRKMRILSRVIAVALVLMVVGAAALSRINIFEQAFHPVGSPQFLSAEKAKWDNDDMLIAVALGGEAHAYPIRAMGYHHVVNDFVAGVPIVATY